MSEELKELRSIKKLLILLLQANKVDQGEIARVLGLTQPAISKILNPRREKNAQED